MSRKKRHTVTTIESHEVWIIKRPAPTTAKILCEICAGGSTMLTPQRAATEAGVSERTVFRWIDDGAIHFAETADGMFVCLAPLTVEVD
ncbi:MAG: hypothetical protein ABR607_11785 [Pyrinomonadaceae bacterium]